MVHMMDARLPGALLLLVVLALFCIAVYLMAQTVKLGQENAELKRDLAKARNDNARSYELQGYLWLRLAKTEPAAVLVPQVESAPHANAM